MFVELALSTYWLTFIEFFHDGKIFWLNYMQVHYG